MWKVCSVVRTNGVGPAPGSSVVPVAVNGVTGAAAVVFILWSSLGIGLGIGVLPFRSHAAVKSKIEANPAILAARLPGSGFAIPRLPMAVYEERCFRMRTPLEARRRPRANNAQPESVGIAADAAWTNEVFGSARSTQ